MRRYTTPILITLAAALLVGWQWWARTRPLEVPISAARTGPLEAEWSAVGYVEARTAHVTAPQMGRVQAIYVREGDRVRAGQVLAMLASDVQTAAVAAQSEGVGLAEAQSASARASLLEAERLQRERERRAGADVASADARWRQAVAALARSRKVVPAQREAARAETEAAQAALRDLERGSRPEEVAQADAEVTAAEATALRAKTECARVTGLYKEGAASRRDVESAEEAQTRAEAALRARREAAALLKKGSREDQVVAARARLRSAQAQERAAEGEMAGLAVEERRVAEARSLLRSAEAAKAECRAGRERLSVLGHEIRAAEARARQSRAGARQAGAELMDRRVAAPFDGIVGRRMVDPGDMASPAQPLFTVVETGRAWVAAEVDEQDLAPVHAGQPVTITAPAYAGREFTGRVERIGGEAIPQTEVRTGARIVRVRVSLAGLTPQERALLKPGMEVHAAGRATLASSALLVASRAVLSDGNGGYVWVINDGRAHRRRVRAGRLCGRETEILEGIRAGDQAIVGGQEELAEGARVAAKR